MCYRVKFGRSASKGVRIKRSEPPKMEALGIRLLGMGGVAGLKKHAPPYVLSCSPAFQGHSRSSEPTRINWLPVTFRSNH